jgi:hypothetical protein
VQKSALNNTATIMENHDFSPYVPIHCKDNMGNRQSETIIGSKISFSMGFYYGSNCLEALCRLVNPVVAL